MWLLILLGSFVVYAGSENDMCVDRRPECPDWASAGECKLTPDYMLTNCKLSCGVCQPGPCANLQELCQSWASEGECKKNPAYMLTNCRQSCGFCEPTPSTNQSCVIEDKALFPVDTCVVCSSQTLTACQFNTTESVDGVCEPLSTSRIALSRIRTRSRNKNRISPFYDVSDRGKSRATIIGAMGPIYKKPEQCYSNCSLYINKNHRIDDCMSCTRPNPWQECVFVRGTGSCLSTEQARADGLEHSRDYYKTNQECYDNCYLRLLSGYDQEDKCYKCTENPNCVFVLHFERYPSPPPWIPPYTPEIHHCEFESSNYHRYHPNDYLYNHPSQCLNGCENIQNSAFPVDTCLNCVMYSYPFCQFISGEPQGICEKYWPHKKRQELGSRPRDSIHTLSHDCYSDCELFINHKNPLDDCISCTRINPSEETCFFHKWDNLCLSERHVRVFSGYTHLIDYYKTNQECANDCRLRIDRRPGTNPQQKCIKCTENSNCIFVQENSYSSCVARNSTLPPGTQYNNKAQCLNDCRLTYRENVTSMQNCIACTTFNFPNGACAFKLKPSLNCDKESKIVMDGMTEGTDYALRPIDCTPVCKRYAPTVNT